MDKCSICGSHIPDGVGRFNRPDGVRCRDCGNAKVKQPKFTDIAGKKIETNLLLKYAEKVDMTRQAARVGKGTHDPILTMQALHDRTEIHKIIFKKFNMSHESMTKKAMKIRDSLEKWLEAHVIEKPHGSNLF